MFYRPRGLHLDETNALPGEAVSGSLFDLAAVFFETAAQRRAAAKDAALQAKLCFYIPKTESYEEAAWFSDVIADMETAAGVPVGTTKIMFLIESLPAAYQVEEILFAARRHVIGLNLGRWDYMASLLHFKLADPEWILPDRNTIPHDILFFQNLRRRLVDACHRRGVLAIGGMSALFPDRTDAAVNARALERLAADKKNEASFGFDGAWTGHPDQHEGAISQFPPNQLGVTHADARRPGLTPSPAGVGAVASRHAGRDPHLHRVPLRRPLRPGRAHDQGLRQDRRPDRQLHGGPGDRPHLSPDDRPARPPRRDHRRRRQGDRRPRRAVVRRGAPQDLGRESGVRHGG
jgi:malate synthase